MVFLLIKAEILHGQESEPDIIDIKSSEETPYKLGYHGGVGFLFELNDFGIGIGMQMKQSLGPGITWLNKLYVTGLTQSDETIYFDYLYGQTRSNHKYQQAFTFPLFTGFQFNIFSKILSRSFRPHITIMGGPVFALTYPYFNDINENGFKDPIIRTEGRLLIPNERDNSIFQGLNKTKIQFGWGGKVSIGADIGNRFKRWFVFQFGLMIYRFSKGIQLLEPNRPIIEDNQYIINSDGSLASESFNAPTKTFITPVITLTFGSLWK